MSQSFTNKEVELLLAIFKSHGGIKPSWTKIQEMGFMPEGMTYSAAAQTWFKMKKKLRLDAVEGSCDASAGTNDASPESPVKKKRGRPRKSVVATEDVMISDGTIVDATTVLGKRKRGRPVQGSAKKVSASSVDQSPAPLRAAKVAKVNAGSDEFPEDDGLKVPTVADDQEDVEDSVATE